MPGLLRPQEIWHQSVCFYTFIDVTTIAPSHCRLYPWKAMLILLLFTPLLVLGQKQGQARIDSLVAEVPKMKEDTNGSMLLHRIAYAYSLVDAQQGLKWAEKELALARKIAWRRGETDGLLDVALNQQDLGAYPEAIEAMFAALKIAEEDGDREGVRVVYARLGSLHYRRKDYEKALEYYMKCLDMTRATGNKRPLQSVLGNIGQVYKEQGKLPEALEYQKESLKMAEELNERSSIVVQVGNIATTYTSMKEYGLAFAYKFKALRLAEALGQKQSIALNLGNIGTSYYSIAQDSVGYTADSLMSANRAENLSRSIKYLRQAIDLSEEIRFMEAVQTFSLALSEALTAAGDHKAAFEAYKSYVVVKDSMYNNENTRKLTRTELGYQYARKEDSTRAENEKVMILLQKEMQLSALRYEYDKKQAMARTEREREQLQFEEALKRQAIETDYARKQAAAEAAHQKSEAKAKEKELLTKAEIHRQKNLITASVVGVALLLLIIFVTYRAYRQNNKNAAIIASEKQRSDNLLLNILPAEVAEELKLNGTAQARHFENVSVLFTDFVGFTNASENMSPQALVQELHECFTAFDAIIEKHGMEKIKTIGDAYMAVGGIPHASRHHALQSVRAAHEIIEFIEQKNRRGGIFQVRVGISSGAVVAGIVGVKKFAYDIWGDTVNMAARMEQNGAPGQVNVSKATYELVKNDFTCEYRGKVAAKNKGEVEMYFVHLTKTARAGHSLKTKKELS